MLIQLLRSTMIAGEPVPAGSTTDVEATVATMLIGIGKAQLAPAAPEPAAPAKSVEPPVLDSDTPSEVPAKPSRRSR